MDKNIKPLPKGLWIQSNGKIALTVCPICKRENYAFNILSGICTWCGYNANKDKL